MGDSIHPKEPVIAGCRAGIGKTGVEHRFDDIVFLVHPSRIRPFLVQFIHGAFAAVLFHVEVESQRHVSLASQHGISLVFCEVAALPSEISVKLLCAIGCEAVGTDERAGNLSRSHSLSALLVAECPFIQAIGCCGHRQCLQARAARHHVITHILFRDGEVGYVETLQFGAVFEHVYIIH